MSETTVNDAEPLLCVSPSFDDKTRRVGRVGELAWCSPCQREAALLASAARAQRGRVVFVGVDVNDLTADARDFLRVHHVPYVAVHSGRSIANRFGLIGLPETFYVDRRGRIQDVTRGELSAAVLQRALGRALQN